MIHLTSCLIQSHRPHCFNQRWCSFALGLIWPWLDQETNLKLSSSSSSSWPPGLCFNTGYKCQPVKEGTSLRKAPSCQKGWKHGICLEKASQHSVFVLLFSRFLWRGHKAVPAVHPGRLWRLRGVSSLVAESERLLRVCDPPTPLEVTGFE